MSFIGYNFENAADAMPMAIRYGDVEAEEFRFAIGLAKRLECYVLVGYVEKEEKNGEVLLYNSAFVIDRKGVPIMNYRKTHLYFNDELWCKPGDGFKELEIINTKGEKFRSVIGICMDIN